MKFSNGHKFLTAAGAKLAIGKPEAALASVIAGLEAVEKTGGAPLEAELHRLKGEALLAGAGTVSEAEAAFEKGINVARRQNAKSWELRCATSLARLRRQARSRSDCKPASRPPPALHQSALQCHLRTFTARCEGQKPSRLCLEGFEQRLCFFQIGRAEPFGEPAADGRAQFARLFAAALVGA